jgi:hypothetical protein
MKGTHTMRNLAALAAICLLASCGTVPKQKYFEKGSLTTVRRVVVAASSESITVDKSRAAGNSILALPLMLLSPLALLAWEPIEYGIRSGVDSAHATALRSARPTRTIAERLGEHFTKTLSERNVFESIQEMPPDAKGGPPPEYLRNNDALIRLRVTEVSLKMATRDELSLFVELSAEMVSLRGGKESVLIWKRREALLSEETHTLEFYKTQGIPALDSCLAKLAGRLADDITYSK